MASIHERRLELGGFRTRALELSPAVDTADPTLVLIHGFSDSADTWRPLMRLLAVEGRGALAIDLPGFGQADRLARDRPILPQLDRCVVAAVEHAAAASPTRTVILSGNSLGGCEALRLAQRSALPIEAIVPIAPAGLDLAGWIGVIEGAWAVQSILRSPLPLPEFAVRQLVGQAYRQLGSAHPGDLEPEVVAAFTRSFRSKRDVVRLLGTARTLRSEIRDPFQLEWIACPVLVIWGDRDRLVSVAGAKRILDQVPQARLEVIERCGHCPQVEYPERVAELISEFASARVAASAAQVSPAAERS